MNKFSKEKQQQLIFVAFITVIVIGIIYAFVIRAQAKSRDEKLAQISTLQDGVDKANNLKKKAPTVQAELDKVKVTLDEMEKNMASGDLYSWVILTVNKFKTGHNVDIPYFSREERAHVGIFPEFPYDAVKYTVKGSAYYHDFGKFLAEFENTFPLIRVQNLDLMPEGGVNDGPEAEKLSFKMDIIVLQKPKENK